MHFSASRRTRTLIAVSRAVSWIVYVVAAGLILSPVGNLAFGWEDASVPTMSVSIVYAAGAVLIFRLAVRFPAKLDKRRAS